MTVFQVDSAAVASASTAATATIGQVQADLGRLSAQLSALQSEWTGAASAAFQAKAEQWRTTQRVVEDNLLELARALAAAGAQYDEIEQANARMFAG
ncbi:MULTISPECIES: WXG100 family type VII secretion target [unclassified Plantibacter]|jgi:early secretory antigenic target protein ESAT-6|uniref:WXG100 family type VII secretion target n=1 Tax=unclassified Plantibacter TaxID=2624265 RepID=UPI003D3354BD